jgi:maleate cis-trans isomerase
MPDLLEASVPIESLKEGMPNRITEDIPIFISCLTLNTVSSIETVEKSGNKAVLGTFGLCSLKNKGATSWFVSRLTEFKRFSSSLPLNLLFCKILGRD